LHISFSELTACAGCRVLVQCVVYLQLGTTAFGTPTGRIWHSLCVCVVGVLTLRVHVGMLLD